MLYAIWRKHRPTFFLKTKMLSAIIFTADAFWSSLTQCPGAVQHRRRRMRTKRFWREREWPLERAVMPKKKKKHVVAMPSRPRIVFFLNIFFFFFKLKNIIIIDLLHFKTGSFRFAGDKTCVPCTVPWVRSEVTFAQTRRNNIIV